MSAQRQISKIQHRRGPLVDLSGVTLNTGELGWAFDERRLFIGNRVVDGAPQNENVEILTSISGTIYEYIQSITPSRPTNNRLRDRASILDFGLIDSDSSTQKMIHIQEALHFTRNSNFAAQREVDNPTIFFPSKTYNVSSADFNTVGLSGVRLYPETRLLGDTPSSTIISSDSSSLAVASTSDSTGITRYSVAPLATLVENIFVENMQFVATSLASPLLSLDNARNVYFMNCKFVGDGTTSNILEINRNAISDELGNIYFINCEFEQATNFGTFADLNTTNGLYFIRCKFSNLTNGIVVQNGIRNFVVKDCYFDTITNTAISIATVNEPGHIIDSCYFESCGTGINFTGNNHRSLNNRFDTCTTGIEFNASSVGNSSTNDIFDSTTTNINYNNSFRNLIIGPQENYSYGNGAPAESSFSTIGSDTTWLTISSNVSTVIQIEYSLTQNSVKRKGRFRVVSDGTNVGFDDDYIEVGGITTLDLKSAMSGSDILLQYNATTNSANFKYEIRTWLD